MVVNREGKSYISEKPQDGSGLIPNGSVVTVIKSTAWSPKRPDTSNWSHDVVVLRCPMEPGLVGQTTRVDEVKTLEERTGRLVSSFVDFDRWVEV
jgi:hypothetical protein